MSPALAVPVYVAAIAIPVLLIWYFHTHWSLHLLALAVAVGLGFIPIPPEMQRPGYDLFFGFVFVSLMIWGAGGLIFHRGHPHHEKHA